MIIFVFILAPIFKVMLKLLSNADSYTFLSVPLAHDFYHLLFSFTLTSTIYHINFKKVVITPDWVYAYI